ncbi:MAG: TetR/AcrR family transcriptional regulator [Elusimicrobia bacterium]|nr:TetR/AcrR family transcriptional regulator [Elusimicrobiota bacterium]
MTPPASPAASADNRRRVVSVALDRFLASGFSAVTMDELARELGMSKKTLYELFPGKTELLREASRLKCENWQVEMQSIAQETTDFFERARRTFRFVAQLYSRLTHAYLTDLRRSAPEVWGDMQEFRRRRVRRNILDLLEQGVREGVLRADLDLETLAAMYLTMTSALLNPEVSGLTSGVEISAAYEAFVRVYFEGLISDAGRRRLAAKPARSARGGAR